MVDGVLCIIDHVSLFGQGVNQMTLEESIAYDQSVVVKHQQGIDLSVPPTDHKGTKAIILDKGFDTGIPGTWSQIVYSGTGTWGWYPTDPIFSTSYFPPNHDGFFTLTNSYNNPSDLLDVGLFTS